MAEAVALRSEHGILAGATGSGKTLLCGLLVLLGHFLRPDLWNFVVDVLGNYAWLDRFGACRVLVDDAKAELLLSGRGHLVEFARGTRLVVYDLHLQAEKADNRLAELVIVCVRHSMAAFAARKDVPKKLWIEEVHNILDKKDRPEWAQELVNLGRYARNWNASIILIDQRASTITDNEVGRGFVNNLAFALLFRHEEITGGMVASLGLSQAAVEFLRGAKKGNEAGYSEFLDIRFEGDLRRVTPVKRAATPAQVALLTGRP